MRLLTKNLFGSMVYFAAPAACLRVYKEDFL